MWAYNVCLKPLLVGVGNITRVIPYLNYLPPIEEKMRHYIYRAMERLATLAFKNYRHLSLIIVTFTNNLLCNSYHENIKILRGTAWDWVLKNTLSFLPYDTLNSYGFRKNYPKATWAIFFWYLSMCNIELHIYFLWIQRYNDPPYECWNLFRLLHVKLNLHRSRFLPELISISSAHVENFYALV